MYKRRENNSRKNCFVNTEKIENTVDRPYSSAMEQTKSNPRVHTKEKMKSKDMASKEKRNPILKASLSVIKQRKPRTQKHGDTSVQVNQKKRNTEEILDLIIECFKKKKEIVVVM